MEFLFVDLNESNRTIVKIENSSLYIEASFTSCFDKKQFQKKFKVDIDVFFPGGRGG